MSFHDWVAMSTTIDISILIFSIAVIWKFRKIQKKLSKIESDLLLTMRNPQAAKRALKERK